MNVITVCKRNTRNGGWIFSVSALSKSQNLNGVISELFEVIQNSRHYSTGNPWFTGFLGHQEKNPLNSERI